MPTASNAARRRVRSLSNRPTVMIGRSILKIGKRCFVGRGSTSSFCSGSTRCCDQVAAPDDDFVDESLQAIALGRELALLDGAFDEYVVAFVEGHRDAGEVTVERQVVPIRVLL